MNHSSLGIGSFPRAILHVDGDSFFVSCQQALNPRLKGRPVVTGKERGIASAMSAEAKQAGITRGMPIGKVRELCPDAVIIHSDYKIYTLFSRRMQSIVRRYTEHVEEYSIDECFADITEHERGLNSSPVRILERIQKDLWRELGITFSCGLGPNKVLAKVASSRNKPNGLWWILPHDIERHLKGLPLDTVWGIGTQTTHVLSSYGVTDARDFARARASWVTSTLSKPYNEIWRELQGECVFGLTLKRQAKQSISATQTFRPRTRDTELLFAHLSRNIENACAKARREGLRAQAAFVYLKTHDFRLRGHELMLQQPTHTPGRILAPARRIFDTLYDPRLTYRATGVHLSRLRADGYSQQDLFGESHEQKRKEDVFETSDNLRARFGKHILTLASTLPAINRRRHGRKHLRGENSRERLGIPYWGEVD